MASYDPVARVWKGCHDPPLFNPEASVGQILYHLLALNPSKVLQIDADSGATMTQGEMRLRAIRLAQNLTALGYRKGEVVTLASGNSENLAPIVLGLLFVGMPFNGIPPNYEFEDAVRMFKMSKPTLVICQESNYELIKKAVGLTVGVNTKVYVLDTVMNNVLNTNELLAETGVETLFRPPYLGNSHEQIAFIATSSGSTGESKAVAYSHAQVLIMFAGYRTAPDEVYILGFTYINWISGLNEHLKPMVIGIPRVFTRKPINAEIFYELMDRYPIGYFFTTPPQAACVLNDPRTKTTGWSKMKSWMVGGEFVSEKLRDSIDALLPNGRSYNIFGMSEISNIANDYLKRKPLSNGILMNHKSAKIVDSEGNSLGVGEIGELVLKLSVPMLGFYNNEDANQKTFEKDGWMHTGDLAYFDNEGYLFVVDRIKEIIKYNFHVYPGELENIISQIPSVKQVAVIGLPDPEGGQDLITAVVTKSSGSSLSENDILQTVHSQVPDHKRLRGGVRFLSEMPLTASGKIFKKALKERFSAAER
ncbi:probable 4-coumarate--CoA ligase 1 [Uranotaenia lowii]|uniref:probable 4-coumarate--CoA ligase 1 n=1 Tax=Uranotaenia lowii TaxID=190385 RepID=UPI002478572B|nr:probable 4-coumarate--CoA ligase 1 [Uranotaenia lowii]